MSCRVTPRRLRSLTVKRLVVPDSQAQGTTTAASSVSVTTSSQNGSLGLLPRSEHHDRGHPIIEAGSYGSSLFPSSSPKASHRIPAGSIPRPREPQPVARSRSRTRTQRRISGSTAAASSSPGSERSTARNGKEERKKPSVGIIGVCALDTKARSKPSRNILNRLLTTGEFDVVIFGDKIILDEEVKNWPVCDFLISFFSDGFPLDKAIAYARLRKPFCVNDLPMQTVLWDRRMCLMILDSQNVPTPKRLEVSRDGGPTLSSPELAQHVYEFTGIKLPGPPDGTGGGKPAPQRVELSNDGDVLRVDGKELYKPFVEKPVSGEDHNIRIYYPKSMGGGGRRLFRKVNNKSSEKDDSLNVPRSITEPQGSYIYEQFLQVEHAEDVKAYTVGPEYCHAETRKSPVVDGIVKRNPQGKEIRYVAKLNKEEVEMASRVVRAFGQTVCGFDLLRANGKSYVIDVNGWSFVKDNNEYYDNCARILRHLFVREKQRREGSTPSSESTEQNNEESKQQQRRRDHNGHRSTLKGIFHSPSMTKLAQHARGHLHRHGTSSPDTVPISSPPSIERSMPTTIHGVSISHPHLPSAAMSDAKAPDVTAERGQASPLPAPASRAQWKLKGIVSVIRHADRTPKQKFKFTFHSQPFVELLRGHQEEVLLIGEAALKSVLDAVEEAIKQGTENPEKLKLLRTTLVKKSSYTGTKVQIKPMFRQRRKSLEPDKAEETVITSKPEVQQSPDIAPTNAEDGDANDWLSKRSDSMAGVTLSRVAAAENNLQLDKLQLIIKWGGEPTHSARYQAQDLGENLRNDLWLMNREILGDVSVFSSSERRVTTSAQIFASTFLNREDLPADFITVRKDLLDDSNAAKDEMDKVKKKLKQLIREGAAPPQFAWPDDTPKPSVVVRQVVELMKFHRKVMKENFAKLRSGAAASLTNIISPQPAETLPHGAVSETAAIAAIQARWCSGEDADLFRERWEKLFKELCDTDKVDPSKISELYDTMKFDALHNRQFLEWVFTPDPSMLEEESGGEPQSPLALSTDKSTPDSSRRPSASDDVPRIPRSQTETYLAENQPPTLKERTNITHRLTFRRKSETNDRSLTLRAPPKSHPIEPAPETYFNLYTGAGAHSRAKLDARLFKLREMYKLSKILFDYIGPQEYGITPDEKLEIGLLTSLPLLREIVTDLEEVQASEGAKCFFYFTKESHIYTLLNCILEGGIKTKIERKNIPELDYLSQIQFELYESQNPTAEGEEESYNYSIRISISPGCHTFDPLDV